MQDEGSAGLGSGEGPLADGRLLASSSHTFPLYPCVSYSLPVRTPVILDQGLLNDLILTYPYLFKDIISKYSHIRRYRRGTV